MNKHTAKIIIRSALKKAFGYLPSFNSINVSWYGIPPKYLDYENSDDWFGADFSIGNRCYNILQCPLWDNNTLDLDNTPDDDLCYIYHYTTSFEFKITIFDFYGTGHDLTFSVFSEKATT